MSIRRGSRSSARSRSLPEIGCRWWFRKAETSSTAVLAGRRSSELFTQHRRKPFGGEDDHEGDDQQQRDLAVLEEVHRRQQLEADAARTDEPQHQRGADILVEPVEADAGKR